MASRPLLRISGFLVGLLALAFVGSVQAQEAKTSEQTAGQDFPAPLAKIQLAEGDTLVFLGDSITHQCLYTQYVEDFFYTRFPKMRIRFHNAGVGGAKAWDALQRFDRDVAEYKPKYVTVLLGMNDGQYQPFQQQIFETYQNDMREVIDRIKQAGAVPILMTPTMFDARAARMRNPKDSAGKLEIYNSVLAYYGQWLREVATRNGHGFVDMYSPLNNLTLQERKTDPRFTMIKDAVHPDAPGQLVMAYALIEDMGLRSPLSNIRILSGRGGKPRAQVSGGTIEGLKVSETGVEFTFKADALPWVLPEEARQGADLLRLGHRASREALEIHNLPEGQYELSIDGQPVGVYSTAQLARHVELQGNAKTPQYQQALKVAELNKERNSGPVRSLRNEWLTFQMHARLAKSLKDKPDNKKLEEQVAKLAQQLENQEQRLREHEAAAKKMEDQIFAINQPPSRRYVLKRIERAKATGTVTLDGKPLANATLGFHGQTPAGNGIAGTDEAGQYQIRSQNRPGIMPGTYRVTFQVKNADPANPPFPKSYLNPQTTPLTVEIKDGENQFDFDLKSP